MVLTATGRSSSLMVRRHEGVEGLLALIAGEGARRAVYTCEFRVTENMDPLEISKVELKELS